MKCFLFLYEFERIKCTLFQMFWLRKFYFITCFNALKLLTVNKTFFFFKQNCIYILNSIDSKHSRSLGIDL